MEREVAGFHLTETAHPPGFKLPAHAHENASFYLVLRGGFTETYGGDAYECKPSSFVFTPAGQIHSNYFHGAGGSCFLVELPPHFLKSVCARAGGLDRSTHLDGGPPAWLAARAYDEAQHLDDLSPLVFEGLALEILAALSRLQAKPERRHPRWLEQAKELLHARFSEQLTIGEISKTVGVHPVYLAAVFRRSYRCSIGDYIRRLRVQFACQMIATSDVPLVKVALAAGFCDQSHFSKVFKSLVGLTPTQYRKSVGRLKRTQNTSINTRY
jgi:AraC family transcriptional regulator